MRIVFLVCLLMCVSPLIGECAIISNSSISVEITASGNGNFVVTDLRNNIAWDQHQLQSATVTNIASNDTTLSYDLTLSEIFLQVSLELSDNKVIVVLSADADTEFSNFNYPFPFVTPDNFYYIFPYNEGVILPVTTSDYVASHLTFSAGWTTSMPFWGYTNMYYGYMCIVDSFCDINCHAQMHTTLDTCPYIASEKGKFVYDRQLTYYFYDSNSDYNDMCVDVRQWMDDNGYLKTFDEKAVNRPNVANIKNAGKMHIWNNVESILTSLSDNGVNEMIVNNDTYDTGYLRDIYILMADSYDPDDSPNGSSDGWGDAENEVGDAAIIDSEGSMIVGFADSFRNSRKAIYEFDAETYPKLLRGEINTLTEAGLVDGVFIDTTTSHGFTEDYAPTHLMTRRDDLYYRDLIFQYAAGESSHKYIVGSEQGCFWAVPYCDYFEGMLTWTKYWSMADYWEDNSARQESYPTKQNTQIDYTKRVPLWELVFSDCAQSYFRWTDSYIRYIYKNIDDRNTKLLLTILYGCNPMIMVYASRGDDWSDFDDFNVHLFTSCFEVGEYIKDSRMIRHSFINGARDKQRTVWENGVVIEVDFGTGTYTVKYNGSIVINKNAYMYKISVHNDGVEIDGLTVT